MAVFKNYYEILGVEVSADAGTIKSAFRKLARQYHPDLNGNNQQAEEKFKEVNEAYEVLNNAEKRAMHDTALQALQRSQANAKQTYKKEPNGKNTTKNEKSSASAKKEAPRQATAAQDASPKSNKATSANELFESFFDMVGKKGFSEKSTAKQDEPIFRAKPAEPHEKAARGEDVVVKTTISPKEASDGVVKTVNVQHNEICRRCSGTGKVNGVACSACHGEKIIVRLKKIDVRIPSGVKTGSRVRVAKEGGRGTGGAENGDLFLQIEILIDPTLRIEGLNVYGEIRLALTDAVLGTDIEVSTINGPVRMNIPPGTQTGKTFRLKEQGIQNNLTKGDHYVTVSVSIPENLSAREKELYQELARLRSDKPK